MLTSLKMTDEQKAAHIVSNYNQRTERLAMESAIVQALCDARHDPVNALKNNKELKELREENKNLRDYKDHLLCFKTEILKENKSLKEELKELRNENEKLQNLLNVAWDDLAKILGSKS